MAASLATLWAGMTLVWALVRPGVVEQVGTASLVGVVALLAAPGLALLAMRLDTRVARAARPCPGADTGETYEHEAWGTRASVVSHTAHAPRAPRQSRRVRVPSVEALGADQDR